MLTNHRPARSSAISTFDILRIDWLSRTKPCLDIEKTGFSQEKHSIFQRHKSDSSYISFAEKFIAVMGVMFVSINSTLETFNKKSLFLSNGGVLQLVNSVLPIIVSNLSSSLSILRQVDTNQTLLLDYQQSYKNHNKHLDLNRYQLMIKIGLRAAFHDNLPIAKRLESNFIDHMTQMYFSGNTLGELTLSLDIALKFLEENPVPTHRYLKMLLFSVLSTVAIVVAYFGSTLICSNTVFAVTGLVATTVVSAVIFVSHFLEHSTMLAPAVKKRVNLALDVINAVEEQAERITSGIFVQVEQEEKQYLEQQFNQLTNEHALMLFGIIPEQTNLLQAVQPVPTGAEAWRFFKHYSAYVKERSLVNIHKEYTKQLEALKTAFNRLKNELIMQILSILPLLPNQEDLNLVLNDTLDFEVASVEIHASLINLEQFIRASNVQGHEDVADLVNEFKEQYVPFLVRKEEYNTALKDVAYLQQRR